MKKIKNFYYSVITADLDFNVRKHAQEDMKDLGFNVIKCEPFPIADCWWFRCNEYPDKFPDYIMEMNNGFKFSDEV